MTPTPLPRINAERLLETFAQSNRIGATAGGGLHRLALSAEDREMRLLFMSWLEDLGLDVRVDDFGNIYGRRAGAESDRPIMLGSHLDTQPNGGRYDGILGVLGALEVLRTLDDLQITTRRPIEIVNFTNEEGARFTPPMLGSAGATWAIEKDELYAATDPGGTTFADALRAIDFMGDIAHRLERPAKYLELHIEQGPVLDDRGIKVGVVEGINGYDWLSLTVIGEANHAGSTPMLRRRDALAGAAEMISHIMQVGGSTEDLRTTVGRIAAAPDTINVVPGTVTFTLDIRHQDDAFRAGILAQLLSELERIAAARELGLATERIWETPATHFCPDIQSAVQRAAEELGLSTHRMFSGPGHDAKYLADIGDAGMIFVPSVAGISHAEQEFTPDEDLVNGANVLLRTVLAFADMT